MEMDVPPLAKRQTWSTRRFGRNCWRTIYSVPVMAVAADVNGSEPRKISFKGAKQALTAFAPKI